MNKQPAVEKEREGQKPVGKEMVRDLLQNRVYTGKVPYAETFYSGSLGEGKRSSRNRKQWFEGKHEPIIWEELFEYCQEVRKKMTKHRRPYEQVQTYLLYDRVYCVRCVTKRPNSTEDAKYGKMRPGYSGRANKASYRCLCRDRGYGQCD